MNNQVTFRKDQQGKSVQQLGGIDPLMVLSLIKKNWYYFVASIVICLLGARFYIGHTLPEYMSRTSILITETGERTTIASNEDLLQGLGLSGGMRNLENQIMILKSRALTEKALQELPFEIEYYHKTIRNNLSIYPDFPVKIVADDKIPLPRDIEFSIEYLGNDRFNIQSEYDYYALEKSASFGQKIEVPGGTFRVDCLDPQWMERMKGKKLYFMIYSSFGLTNYYNSRLGVVLASRTGSILSVSLVGTNKQKDVDFLNKLGEVFQDISLNKKNTEAIRRINFIDDQLIDISDSLSITENRLQEFRSSHRVMDLSAQGQAIIEQVTILENEKARLNLEANYYDYLADYLAKDVAGELPIVPITMGITDPGLTRLVTELADLQGQLSAKNVGELNPIQNILVQRMQNAKDGLKETLNGLRRANSLARSENQDQINKVNSQASTLPVTERQLLGIERKFRLNNEMYTFLLQTRAEQQMQKASNTADSEIIDPADANFSVLVSPNRNMVLLIALLLGAVVPFLVVYLRFLFNKKISDEDINKLTGIPIVGNIPRCMEKGNKTVFDSPGSSIAEAFRLMRSKMQFFTKDASSPIILVTSSMPEEGKTYTSINLASVYSMLGKKTVLVGFDLRKPKIYMDFDIDNDKGVTSYLIGKEKLQDIIRKTDYENLYIIPSGPMPPNPSELTALSRTDELLKSLRESFDIIIIDSSPIGIISDTFHLVSLADTCVLVVRPGTTLRDILESTLIELGSSDVKGLCLSLNDVKLNAKYNNYGDKYGYTKKNEAAKRSVFRKKTK